MDHVEAHVLQFRQDEVERNVIHAQGKHRHIHHRKGTIGSGKAMEDAAYFAKVVESLDGAQQILLIGPANEKHEFKKHLDAHARALAARVVAVENSDHPTDGELLWHTRKFFVAADGMQPAR